MTQHALADLIEAHRLRAIAAAKLITNSNRERLGALNACVVARHYRNELHLNSR